MGKILESINEIVWGLPVLAMILIVGIGLSFQSRFAQIRLLPTALCNFVMGLKEKDNPRNGTSGYRALCTALAATVGTGNIAGIAGAMALGGPGVIFWMWVCGILGMVTKLAEVTLAVRYRVKNNAGEYMGGPMYMITLGLPRRFHFLAYVYAFFGIVASFGVGNATQVNAVVDGIRNIAAINGTSFGLMGSLAIGVVLAVLLLAVFLRGLRGAGSWAERLVPVAACLYILLSIVALFCRLHRIPQAFKAIISGAFQPKSVTCGLITSAFISLRVGVSRGVFTNEAGMGTASIAHAAAHVEHPLQQGMMGIIEVFLDTIVICTLTALVILCSGVSIPYGKDPGIALTLDAFSCVYGDWIRSILTILVCVLAFATIIGWGFYGARCAQFLFGDSAWRFFVWSQIVGVIVGVIVNTSVVWILAEIVNGLMAMPSLISLILLSPEFFRLLSDNSKQKNAHS